MYRAANRGIHSLEQWPARKSEAKVFLAKLKALKASLSEFEKFEPDPLSDLLINFPEEHRQRLKHGDRFENYCWENVHEATYLETEGSIELLKQAENRLSNYLEDNFLPKYAVRNRTDDFIRTLVHETADIWRRHIRPALVRRRDRQYFVGLLGAALDDFGYPRTEAKLDDVWLYDRVGKYEIWK
jgi:hypothetical protein